MGGAICSVNHFYLMVISSANVFVRDTEIYFYSFQVSSQRRAFLPSPKQICAIQVSAEQV